MYVIITQIDQMNPFEWECACITEAKKIPAQPGCYALIHNNKEILYIGRSKVLSNRLALPHRHQGFVRYTDPWDELRIHWQIGWDVYDCEKELILRYNPRLSLA